MHTRYDQIKIDGKKLKKDSFGFVKLNANLTKTGIFTYLKEDGSIIKELRHPDEVFKEDSLETLKQKPVSNEHPSVFIDSGNIKDHIAGVTGERINILDSELVNSNVTIFEEKTIDDVSDGKREISCGYNCDLDFTQGVYKGEKYDAKQKNIKYNHVAIVERGRAGREVKLRFDSKDSVLVSKENKKEGVDRMDTTKDKDSNPDEKMIATTKKDQEIEALKKKLDEQNNLNDKKMDSLNANLDHSKQENMELKTKVENFDKKLDSEIIKKVNKRIKLYDAAKLCCDDETVGKLDKMSDIEIKKAVIKTQCKTDLAEKSDVYLEARFDMAIENLEKKDNEEIGELLLRSKTDSRDADYRKEFENRLVDNYKSN